MVTVLNFGHILSIDALRALEEKCGAVDVRDIRVHLDMKAPLAPQVEAVVAGVELTPAEWTTRPILVVLPGMMIAASIVLAAICGRRGTFPSVIHLNRGDDGVFRLGEVIDLAEVRSTARLAR